MQQMTKERLEQYPNLIAELAELQHELRHVGDGDSLIGNDVINDYRTGYPRPQSIVGPDWDTLHKRVERYSKMIDKVRGEINAIEVFIDEIEDSQLRRIFRLRYIEGLKLKEVGKRVHLDKSNVSRKIDDYLKSQPTQQKQLYNR